MVGATDRPGSYAGETLLNLRALGYAGEVWGVNPGREEAHGFPCFGSLSDCPAAPDAVVVAIPAAGVPAVVDEAGAHRLRRRGGLRRRLRRGAGGTAPGAGAGRGRAPPRAAAVRAERERHRGPARARCALGRRPARARGRPGGAGLAERQRGGERAGHAPRAAPAHGGVVRQRRGPRPGRLDGGAGRARSRWARSPSTSRPTATARGCARRSPAAPSAAWACRC